MGNWQVVISGGRRNSKDHQAHFRGREKVLRGTGQVFKSGERRGYEWTRRGLGVYICSNNILEKPSERIWGWGKGRNL